MNTGVSFISGAHELASALTDIRRDLHRYPELGFQETRTAAALADGVERLIPAARVRSVAGTGLVASLPGEGPGVLLRACMDALPVQEISDREYRSSIPGVAHACGHDGQMAILIGALALLSWRRGAPPIHGLFQPAEEIDAGAQAIIEAGLIDELSPSVALGFHGHPSLPVGGFGVRNGPVMGSITTLVCDVQGREGHGAEPHLASDALTAAAALVIDWQVALARRVDPRQPVVLSIGKLESGSTPNVVPGTARIEGTLRSLDSSIESHLERILREVATSVELRCGVHVTLSLEMVVPAVVNDASTSQLVADAVEELLGGGALSVVEPTLGGDDFAWILRQVPGCYFFVGERQEDRPQYGWHDPSYDLDDRSLVFGSAALAGAALRVATRAAA